MTRNVRHPSHYHRVLSLLERFSFDHPFHLFLTQEFKSNPGWGSKDRKAYRELSYLYLKNFRLFEHRNLDEKISLLKQLDAQEISSDHDPYFKWQHLISLRVHSELLSPWYHEVPPIFFLKWSEDYYNPIFENGTPIPTLKNSSAFPAQTELQPLVNKGYGIIQDVSSSQVLFQYGALLKHRRIWDCCSGAGGKSLVISKFFEPKHLICSDIRESILVNLSKRFELNNIRVPELHILDMEHSISGIESVSKGMDIIFADVPCSGSGTWRRNPEYLLSFQEEVLEKYTQRQENILKNLAKHTQVKTIIYCTCSLFRSENEDLIESFLSNHPEFECIRYDYFGEVENIQQGDFLFAALLQR
jgi:16S rRNA (cytosine967-C5)-methyltransferase